jgi:hypothetical protein
MKSPARVPRLQGPVGVIAPTGDRVLTPFGEMDWAAMVMPRLERNYPGTAVCRASACRTPPICPFRAS